MRRKTQFGGGFCLLCAVMLAVLLTGGGRRLIAGSETESAQRVKTETCLNTGLCSLPAQSGSFGTPCRGWRDDRAEERICGLSAGDAVALSPGRVDANGNVLNHRNYLHALYQVFALGDGFV